MYQDGFASVAKYRPSLNDLEGRSSYEVSLKLVQDFSEFRDVLKNWLHYRRHSIPHSRIRNEFLNAQGENLFSEFLSVYTQKDKYGSDQVREEYTGRASKELVAVIEEINHLVQEAYAKPLQGNECLQNFLGRAMTIDTGMFCQFPGFPKHSYKNDAKRISGGQYLSHIMPVERMENVLRTGRLSSVKALRQEGDDSPRTYLDGQYSTMFDVDIPPEEIEAHQICFEVDRLYKQLIPYKDRESFQDGRLAAEVSGPVALVFSQNWMLKSGRKFIESDGFHVFDENYEGHDHDHGALSIDLRETSFCFLVLESEKERFVEFLKTESVWADELQAMSDKELETWIDEKCVIQLPRERQQRRDVLAQELLSRLPEPVPGFVVDNGTTICKTGKKPLCEFVPFENHQPTVEPHIDFDSPGSP